MFAAELNLGAAFGALGVGAALLAVVWVLDRRALQRELEADDTYDELEAVDMLVSDGFDAVEHADTDIDDLDQRYDEPESSVRVLGTNPPTAKIEAPTAAKITRPAARRPAPEPELQPEPELEPEPEVAEPEPSAARSSLPKGAESILASLDEVVPDPRNTTVRVKDPTAEVSVRRPSSTRSESSDGDWDTPSEPSGAELMARVRERADNAG